MKKRITVSIPPDILKKIDRMTRSTLSRSAVIEHILCLYFQRKPSGKIHARDLERINAAAGRLNSEAEDILSYQILKN